MLRFLIKFLLLSIIAVVSVMLIAQWQLDETLEEYKRLAKPYVDVRYESAELSYNGEITLNSVVAYVDKADLTFEIGKIKFSVGNLKDLAFFKSNIENKQIPDKGYLIIEDLLLPFNNQLVKSVKKLDLSNPWQVISWAHCGEVKEYAVSSFEAMGYDYVAADTSLFYMLDKYSGSVVLNGIADIEDAARIEYQVNVGSVLAWLESQRKRDIGQSLTQEVEPEVSLLEVRLIDSGLNERKARMCAQKQNVSIEEYYSQHVEKVNALFDEVGIKASESFAKLYPELIKPESEFYWFMQPKANFQFEGITYYTYEEFIELGGLRLLVNKKNLDLFSEGWSFDSFKQILTNAKARNKKTETPRDLYKTVIVEREFRTFQSIKASQFVGLKARVQRADGKLFEGKISKSNDLKVWLLSRTVKGELTMPIPHKDIEKFEVLVQVN